jgi:hypothetical protein
MEKCVCGGSGYIMEKGKPNKPCICKILKIYNTYLYPFKEGGKPPTPAEKALVLKALMKHVAFEKSYERRLKEETGNEKITNVKQPRHWYFIDSERAFVQPDGKRIGTPGEIYMPFFFEYLVRTKEYISYKIFDMVTLQNIYYEYGDDDNIASADVEGGGTGFYGYGSKTFIIKLTNVLPGKEGFNILRHFIDTYKDRNILIYAESQYAEKPRIRKWTGDSFKEVLLEGEKSFKEIMTQEYKSTFINLVDYLKD